MASTCYVSQYDYLNIYAQVPLTPLFYFIRVKIKDDEIGRDPLAAWACIRLDRLREGYRLVHLHDCSGEKNGGVLLVKISKVVS
jgi:hypothetical protein